MPGLMAGRYRPSLNRINKISHDGEDFRSDWRLYLKEQGSFDKTELPSLSFRD